MVRLQRRIIFSQRCFVLPVLFLRPRLVRNLSRCLPPGPPRINYIFPIQNVQNPGLIIGLHEYVHVFRAIHTDGRPHPEDPNPTFRGDSVGHWEGDTLVVDVVGFKPGWYDLILTPYTLWNATRSLKFKKQPAGFELYEYECSENEKDLQHLVGK